MSNGKEFFLSVIIPCFNESKNIEAGNLGEVYTYLQGKEFAWEIIVVEDGSTDDSASLVRNYCRGKSGISLIEIPHQGKPFAVRAGVEAAVGEVVLILDMDLSSPIAELIKLLPWYGAGFDAVIGSRNRHCVRRSRLRQLGGTVFRTLRRIVILQDIVDTQCGFKLCSRKRLLDIMPRMQYFQQVKKAKGWKVSAYDVELLFLLKYTGCRIKEVEIEWCNRDKSVTKHPKSESAKYVRESLEMAVEVLRVKVNQVRGVYR